MNHFIIPYLNTFKFIKDKADRGIHFDDDFTFNRIRDFERRVKYWQKWQTNDTTRLQVESSIMPQALQLIDLNNQVVKQFNWSIVFAAINYNIYELEFNTSDVNEGIYFLFFKVSLLTLDWRVISEPIHIKDKWHNTLQFKYKNRYNDWGIAFSTGIEFSFRCEAAIADYSPGRERSSAISQTRKVATLSGTPYRTFTLYIGDEGQRVAPYVVDLLNRIFVCSSIEIEGMFYQSEPDAKWEVNRLKGFPLLSAAIDIVETDNKSGLSFSDSSEIAAGIVTAYNIETAFFGAGNLVPITDIEKQG